MEELAELESELVRVNAAITRVLEHGEESQVGTASGMSTRIARASLDRLTVMRNNLKFEIQDLKASLGVTKFSNRVSRIV